MVSDTLVIKRFPVDFSVKDKEEFLKQCGAIQVNAIYSKRNKYNVTFAQFKNEDHAKEALYKLHQQEISGSYLSVEYAKKKDFAIPVEAPNVKTSLLNDGGTEFMMKRFVEKLSRWVAGADLRVPVPCHLHYQYPPPTSATLRNIQNLLQSTPRLYTQVLHLINKMNLPCPISEESALDLPLSQPPPELLNVNLPIDSESELSSDEGHQHRETIPYLASKPKKPIRKRNIMKPFPLATATVKQPIELVFEDPKSLLEEPKTKKRRIVPIKENSNPSFKASDNPNAEGFGILEPLSKSLICQESNVKKLQDLRNPLEEERLEHPVIHCITIDELNSNRISEKDRSLLQVFKNYAEGTPTCRLYLKNLAKQTTEEELRHIYSRYLSPRGSEDPEVFDIRLMQEGRMKGQAFITFQSVNLAKKALEETNGYILNDKPMVVQFARSASK